MTDDSSVGCRCVVPIGDADGGTRATCGRPRLSRAGGTVPRRMSTREHAWVGGDAETPCCGCGRALRVHVGLPPVRATCRNMHMDAHAMSMTSRTLAMRWRTYGRCSRMWDTCNWSPDGAMVRLQQVQFDARCRRH